MEIAVRFISGVGLEKDLGFFGYRMYHNKTEIPGYGIVSQERVGLTFFII